MGRGRPGTGVEPLKETIRVSFTWQGRRHRETLDLQPTATNIRAAERLVAGIKQQIDRGIFDYAATFPGSSAATTHTFADYTDAWIETFIGAKSTKRSYTTALRFWKAHLGPKTLTGIKHTDIAIAVAARAKGVSGKTVNNCLIPLRLVFATAVADDILKATPVARIKNMKHQAPEPDPFTADEMHQLLGYMAAKQPEQVWNYFDFAFSTGLRPSEEIIVPWGNVDWRTNQIRIDSAHVDGEDKDTKTSKVRYVDLNPQALAALERQKQHTFMKGLDAPIFENPYTHRPWNNDDRQRRIYFQPAMRALGMRARDAYQCRHTFATILLMGGLNVAYIAGQLGHASINTTLKHYARWINGADKGTQAKQAGALFAHSLSIAPAKVS